MNRHIITCSAVLLSLALTIEAQIFRPNTEAGVFAGASYYQGDINPRKPFYRPGPAAGALMKHNFAEHHCLRFYALYGQLEGNDLDFQNELQQLRAHSFKTSLLDLHFGYEFNFMPQIINRRKASHASTYIFAAIGYSLIISTDTGRASVDDRLGERAAAVGHATIPFGVGFKYRINDRISAGCEWGMRKSFSDKIDGLLNPGPDGSYSPLHNNDWYSFAGFYLTFKVFEKKFFCPGIKEQPKYR